jgi:ubiquinone biosynthesis protein
MIFRRFQQIGETYSQVNRVRIIAGVLLKYGYDDLALRLPLPSPERLPLKSLREQQEAVLKFSHSERVRRAAEELGPTFVKLGQLAAARTRLLPPEYTEELSKLQDRVEPLPFEQIRPVIEEELGAPISQIFKSFIEAPIGSASMAQVYSALLHTGESVVVKIQRPGIEKIVLEDVAVLRHIASLVETHMPEWRVHRPVAMLEELARTLEKELDFTTEASSLDRFTWQFRDEPLIYVPKVYHEFTTPRILVMEEMRGVKASEVEALQQAGHDLKQLSARISDLVMKQIFDHGFFHADPHPGNIQVMPDQRICFLDFGMMGFLNLRTRETFIDMVWGISRRNESLTASALLKLADPDVEPPRSLFEADVAEFMHQHFYRPAGEISFSHLVTHLLRLTGKHGLQLPPDLVVMLKALGQTEELVRRLDPGHDIIGQAAPFLKRTRLKRLNPRRLTIELMEFGHELAEMARELPSELRRIMTQIKSGKVEVHFRHEGLEPLSNAVERSANRLSFALVVAALIIGSSLMSRSMVPPLWGGVSIWGLVGYLMAGFMGFWLLIGIMRHGKM